VLASSSGGGITGPIFISVMRRRELEQTVLISSGEIVANLKRKEWTKEMGTFTSAKPSGRLRRYLLNQTKFNR
jgi:hypothetical protein